MHFYMSNNSNFTTPKQMRTPTAAMQFQWKRKRTLCIRFEFPRRPGLISPLQNISHLLILLHKWLLASYSMLSPLLLFFGCVFFSCGPKWRETQLIRVSKQKMAERIVSLHVEEVRKNAVHRHLSLNREYILLIITFISAAFFSPSMQHVLLKTSYHLLYIKWMKNRFFDIFKKNCHF